VRERARQPDANAGLVPRRRLVEELLARLDCRTAADQSTSSASGAIIRCTSGSLSSESDDLQERHARTTGPGWPMRFTGRVSDSMLDSLIAQASVVTSASDCEEAGLTLAQGLASGARVVASSIRAHADLARRAGPGAPDASRRPKEHRSVRRLASRLPVRGPHKSRRGRAAVLGRYSPGHPLALLARMRSGSLGPGSLGPWRCSHLTCLNTSSKGSSGTDNCEIGKAQERCRR
jgi:hypothetical protein